MGFFPGKKKIEKGKRKKKEKEQKKKKNVTGKTDTQTVLGWSEKLITSKRPPQVCSEN